MPKLEDEYPGIWAAAWVAIEPELRRSIEADYPTFWGALEKIYLSHLTESEAQGMLDFYRSPTGQKLLRGMLDNLDTGPLLKDIVASPSGDISAEQLKSVGNAAKAKAVAQIGPEDTGELMILLHYVDLEKFRLIGAETQKVTLAWVNKTDPEADKRLQDLIGDALKRYMAAHAPAKKK